MERRTLVYDGLVAAAVTATAIVLISSDVYWGHPPDILGFTCALCMGVLVFFRRSFPVGTLIGTAIVLLIYYTSGSRDISLAVTLAVGLYTVSDLGRPRWAIAVALGWLGVAIPYRVLTLDNTGYVLGNELPTAVAIFGLAIALGDVLRSRRLLGLEQAENALRHIQEERLRIARDVHDVVAHNIAVVSLQAGVACDALSDDPAVVEKALGTIRAVNSTALRDLQTMLRVLRDGADEGADQGVSLPTAGLADVADLVNGASGLDVTVRVHGPAAPLPAAVDSTAFRIVQEALTNVLKHARATRVGIDITHAPEALTIAIRDDGSGGTPTLTRGIAGMSERAKLIGGWVRAEGVPSGGFGVYAHLPLREKS